MSWAPQEDVEHAELRNSQFGSTLNEVSSSLSWSQVHNTVVGTLGSCAACSNTMVSQLPEGSTWIGLFVHTVSDLFAVIFFS